MAYRHWPAWLTVRAATAATMGDMHPERFRFPLRPVVRPEIAA
jgi:hypothetical protein